MARTGGDVQDIAAARSRDHAWGKHQPMIAVGFPARLVPRRDTCTACSPLRSAASFRPPSGGISSEGDSRVRSPYRAEASAMPLDRGTCFQYHVLHFRKETSRSRKIPSNVIAIAATRGVPNTTTQTYPHNSHLIRHWQLCTTIGLTPRSCVNRMSRVSVFLTVSMGSSRTAQGRGDHSTWQVKQRSPLTRSTVASGWPRGAASRGRPHMCARWWVSTCCACSSPHRSP